MHASEKIIVDAEPANGPARSFTHCGEQRPQRAFFRDS
jgi:hypothetical protein